MRSIDGPSVSRMFNRAVDGRPLPEHFGVDHDPLFRIRGWLANLRANLSMPPSVHVYPGLAPLYAAISSTRNRTAGSPSVR